MSQLNRTAILVSLLTTGAFVPIDESTLDVNGEQLVEYAVTMTTATCDVQLQSRFLVRDANGALEWSEWSGVTTILGATFPGVGTHRIPFAPFGDQVRLAVRTKAGGPASTVNLSGKVYPAGQLADSTIASMIALGPDTEESLPTQTATVTITHAGNLAGETITMDVEGETISYTTIAPDETVETIAAGFKTAADILIAGPLAGILVSAVRVGAVVTLTFAEGAEFTAGDAVAGGGLTTLTTSPTATVTVTVPGAGIGETLSMDIDGTTVSYAALANPEAVGVIAAGFGAAVETAALGALAGIVESVDVVGAVVTIAFVPFADFTADPAAGTGDIAATTQFGVTTKLGLAATTLFETARV